MQCELFDLTGRVALVTGAAGGIGSSIAQAFGACGATLLLADIDGAACERVAARLCEQGVQAHALGCDIADRRSADALVDEGLRLVGRIDVLVCNAAIQGPGGPLLDIADADWDRVVDTNLRSALWLCSRVIPGMAERGAGSVILMSSIAGLRGNKAIGLYGISKAGLAQLARNLALEWGPKGVRVNAISPGVIRTPLARGMIEDSAYMERRLSLTPLRRVGEPDEIAGVAVMLASRAGGFITGHNLVVDGGTTIGDGN
jgi:NAD(P)-dependent dehydrogenase (short-subunit alcohol dehydrogenase family)